MIDERTVDEYRGLQREKEYLVSFMRQVRASKQATLVKSDLFLQVYDGPKLRYLANPPSTPVYSVSVPLLLEDIVPLVQRRIDRIDDALSALDAKIHGMTDGARK